MPEIQYSLKPNALCLVQDVTGLIDSQMDPENHKIITMMINGFTSMAEGRLYCNRQFQKTRYEETFNGDVQCVRVVAPPIQVDELLTVYEDSGRNFADSSRMVLNEDYEVQEEAGVIKLYWGKFIPGNKVVKVIYNGGLSLYDENQNTFTCPDDLRQAAAMQVSFWWKQRGDLGVSQMAFAGGNMSVFSPTKLLPIVEKTLLAYRRFDI